MSFMSREVMLVLQFSQKKYRNLVRGFFQLVAS